MKLQFTDQEIEIIRSYFSKIESGETQNQLYGLHQQFPEWNTVFLLLRKLLAYGVYYIRQTDEGLSYQALQAKTQKPDYMLANVHAYFSQFKMLLAYYSARHSCE